MALLEGYSCLTLPLRRSRPVWRLLAVLLLPALAAQGHGQSCGGCCGNPDICSNYGLTCNYGTCGCNNSSPIIVDTTGHGFHLTSAGNGVFFDILGDGHPIQIAWTDADSGNAFLALDRNHNGVIDSGKELFGNVTEQPNSAGPNGFLALAEFDKPENGGQRRRHYRQARRCVFASAAVG